MKPVMSPVVFSEASDVTRGLVKPVMSPVVFSEASDVTSGV